VAGMNFDLRAGLYTACRWVIALLFLYFRIYQICHVKQIDIIIYLLDNILFQNFQFLGICFKVIIKRFIVFYINSILSYPISIYRRTISEKFIKIDS